MPLPNLLPDADATQNIGKAAVRWLKGFFSGGISDGTNTFTPHGTDAGAFQVDSGNTGPKVKNAAGVLQVRTAADTAFASVQAASFLDSDGNPITTGGADTVAWPAVTDKPSTYTPAAHAATHHTGGGDALAPADIGAEVAGAAATVATNLATEVARAEAVEAVKADLVSGTVPTSQLPAAILGDLHYQGAWDASGGSYPASPAQGQYWVISIEGTMGGVAYAVHDWAVCNGTGWDRLGAPLLLPDVLARFLAVLCELICMTYATIAYDDTFGDSSNIDADHSTHYTFTSGGIALEAGDGVLVATGIDFGLPAPTVLLAIVVDITGTPALNTELVVGASNDNGTTVTAVPLVLSEFSPAGKVLAFGYITTLTPGVAQLLYTIANLSSASFTVNAVGVLAV